MVDIIRQIERVYPSYSRIRNFISRFTELVKDKESVQYKEISDNPEYKLVLSKLVNGYPKQIKN